MKVLFFYLQPIASGLYKDDKYDKEMKIKRLQYNIKYRSAKIVAIK